MYGFRTVGRAKSIISNLNLSRNSLSLVVIKALYGPLDLDHTKVLSHNALDGGWTLDHKMRAKERFNGNGSMANGS
jgi:hypothetical protein